MALILLPPAEHVRVSLAEPVRAVPVALMTAMVDVEGSRTVVALRGNAAESNSLMLCEVLSRVIAHDDGDVVIDLADATLIDTAPVRILATTHQLLDDQGRRLIFRSTGRTAGVLHFFGLAGLIDADTG
jgi:anti-anti-sigma regulatory factor